ncbi:MAG: undecaprenyl/decaprenyl-phosphate alpha-N-acetylglucosaminyl 1-phosphate transferase [Elusimicrobia bacterium]|nr:undecaprenyl/decaprenyl-phosphate alpha-N-acetylglucosaminyl 1-phosphate transferase [Elusimicrobiota bacterium]
MNTPYDLYLICALTALAVTYALTPLVRSAALRLQWMDTPSSAIKTHKTPTPSLGGLGIAAGFFAALLVIRLFTHFPTGTLHNLRGIFIGGAIMLALGFTDDIRKPRGLGVKTKFLFQGIAAAVLIAYGMRIGFISPEYLALALSVIWVVGVSNALNIIDIMDGFASSQAAVAALCFLLIALPSEAVYVNFAAAALAGAALGFLPHNLSSSRKIFMGDSGSLFLGFMLAALSLGASYDATHTLGVLAPLLILAVPIYDTFFVAVIRMSRGCSPFMGSKDHYALRLEKLGLSRRAVVALSAAAAMLFGACAWQALHADFTQALSLYLSVGLALLAFSFYIARLRMD